MARRRKKKIFKILKNINYKKIIIVLGFLVVASGGFYYYLFEVFPANAQSQIKIFPTIFNSDLSADEASWQKPELVFSQDLGENAAFAEFNIANSAYLLEITETSAEEMVTPSGEEIIPLREEQKQPEGQETKEEEKVIKKLRADLEHAEKFVGKEINDIKREVK